MKTTDTTLKAKDLTKEQLEFADANYGLVVKACRSYHVPEDLYEDCLQAGWETLLRKIPDFDSSRARFSTFIFPWLHNAFNEVIRENGDGMTYKPRNMNIRMVSFNKPVGHDGEGNDCSLADLLPGSIDVAEDAVNSAVKNQLYCCIDRLDDREKFIINRRFNLDRREEQEWSLREIASALGSTRTTVSNVLDRACERLRCMLEYGAGMRHAA